MARVAIPLLLAFIALLVFAGWIVGTRRNRRETELNELRHEVTQYEALVEVVHNLAKDSLDIDPSAQLIDMTITKFKKELR